MGVFHAMFFVSLHSTGMPFSSLMPWLAGPRHWGQFEPVFLEPIFFGPPPDARAAGITIKENASRQTINAHLKLTTNNFMIIALSLCAGT
jgi:hypothetical protein